MAEDASASDAPSGQPGPSTSSGGSNQAIGQEKPPKKEPLILWWMPLLALLAPLVFGAWQGASAADDALREAVVAFFWPGAGFYLAALAVLWAGWKIDLE